MIRYTSQSQLTLEGFETPFLQHLDKDNRWVKLAETIRWDKLDSVYYRKMNSGFGAPSLSARMVIGAVIIKHMLNIDDCEVVAQIQENIYLQYFVGLSSFTTKEAFDPSLLVTLRYRLGQDVMEEFNKVVLQQAGIIPSPSKDSAVHTSLSRNGNSSSDTCSDVDENTTKNKKEQHTEPSANNEHNDTAGDHDTLPANSGTLLLDATVAEQQNGISDRSEVAQ